MANILPDQLVKRIVLDAIMLQKNECGWREVHHKLIHHPRYLKHTPYSNVIYKFCTQIKFHFRMDRPYIWMMPIENSSFYGYYDDFEEE